MLRSDLALHVFSQEAFGRALPRTLAAACVGPPEGNEPVRGKNLVWFGFSRLVRVRGISPVQFKFAVGNL